MKYLLSPLAVLSFFSCYAFSDFTPQTQLDQLEKSFNGKLGSMQLTPT